MMTVPDPYVQSRPVSGDDQMQLGNFSLSLAVKDIAASAADEPSTGPASMVLTDPDGNQVLFDQHVPRPTN